MLRSVVAPTITVEGEMVNEVMVTWGWTTAPADTEADGRWVETDGPVEGTADTELGTPGIRKEPERRNSPSRKSVRGHPRRTEPVTNAGLSCTSVRYRENPPSK